MKRLNFAKALLPGGWADNVSITVNESGIIHSIKKDCPTSEHMIEGYAMPGINNIHSHAFQRAMAGLAEYSTSPSDSFWTWRDIMYRFADKITAHELEVIAAQLYVEMLKAGYVSVSEFHYLHDSAGGRNAEPMSRAIMTAARQAGLGLCHLPVLYMSAGFGDRPLSDKQLKFSHGVEDYLRLLSDLSSDMAKQEHQHIGMAFHSLRAVPPEAITRCLSESPIKGPVHIHISEQTQEVDDCLKWSGQRPVEWLYDHADVDDRWCLIHATHLNQEEISSIARSGAVVGICPTTEANLGDGIFPLPDYLAQGGRIAIGSDSHISVSVIEELRLLEYGQRLTGRRRNILVSESDPHTGSHLYHLALAGGAQASGFDNAAIACGKRADIIVLDASSPLLVGTPDRNIVDRFIFSGNQNPVKHVFVAGEPLISDYQHKEQDTIKTEFDRVVQALQKLLD